MENLTQEIIAAIQKEYNAMTDINAKTVAKLAIKHGLTVDELFVIIDL